MIEEFAAAKVNLTLHVGPVRPDGYHPVDSLVVFAGWGDRLTFEPAKDIALKIAGESAETLRAEDGNLVLKAAQTLALAAGLEKAGARIRLHKEIPLGAGLGGGSADAAAALRGLNRLWALDWPDDMLAGIGAEIGSDVPACVLSQPLRMRGRGERVEPLTSWPELSAVLVNPREGVSTAAIFEQYDTDPKPLESANTPSAGAVTDALDIVTVGRNDLQVSAVRSSQSVESVLNALRDDPDARLVRMTGSGSTCFALYDAHEAAAHAAKRLKDKHPGWLVQPVLLGGSRG